MADRKHTPDVLAELLSADLPAAELDLPIAGPSKPMAKSTMDQARVRRTQRPRAPKVQGQVESEGMPDVWEVEIVTFQEHRGWRARYVNGVEVKDWLAGALVHDYANQRGAEGWKLVGAGSASHLYGVADSLQLYFRRRK